MLITLALTAPVSAGDAGNQKEILGSRDFGTSGSETAALIITNKEMEAIMEKVTSFKDSSLLIKDSTQTIENETKEKKMDFSTYY